MERYLFRVNGDSHFRILKRRGAMRRRVLPLDGGAKGGVDATVSTATSASGGRRASGGAAATARSSAVKGPKSKATRIDSTHPAGSADKKTKRRGKKPKKKQQLAAIGVAVGASALVLVLSLFVTFPSSLWRDSASSASDAVASGEVEAVDRFLDWFRAAGGRADSVGVAEFPGMGKGVVARSDIREDDAMLFVPKDIIMYVLHRW